MQAAGQRTRGKDIAICGGVPDVLCRCLCLDIRGILVIGDELGDCQYSMDILKKLDYDTDLI